MSSLILFSAFIQSESDLRYLVDDGVDVPFISEVSFIIQFLANLSQKLSFVSLVTFFQLFNFLRQINLVK